MKHSADTAFAEAAFALQGKDDAQAPGSRAWWIVPFIVLGGYLWLKIISLLTAIVF